MDGYWKGVLAVLCALVMVAVCAAPAVAQTDVKEKPPMYSYVGNWAIPRAQWEKWKRPIQRTSRRMRKRSKQEPSWDTATM